MSKPTAPVFLLRGIEISKIFEEYYKGDFKNIKLDKTKQNAGALAGPKITVKARTQDVAINNTQNHPIYELERNNNVFRMYTTESSLFSEYLLEVNEKSTLSKDNKLQTPDRVQISNVVCAYCRQPIDTSTKDTKDILFIPSVIVLHQKFDKQNIFHGYDVCCTRAGLRCAKSNWTREQKLEPQNTILRESITYLNHIASLLGQDRDAFSEALPDWKLLNANGGPLTPQEFYSNTKTIKKDPNLIFVPVKQQFYVKVTD